MFVILTVLLEYIWLTNIRIIQTLGGNTFKFPVMFNIVICRNLQFFGFCLVLYCIRPFPISSCLTNTESVGSNPNRLVLNYGLILSISNRFDNTSGNLDTFEPHIYREKLRCTGVNIIYVFFLLFTYLNFFIPYVTNFQSEIEILHP